MIQICGKLNKSNTKLRFRCVIFRSGFISSSRKSLRRLEEVHEDEIKPERNITHLNRSLVFDLSNFSHISIILSD